MSDVKTAWPTGVNHLFTFFFFNFVSCLLLMGSPIFLYAESLEASATEMGIISGLTPLMVALQIPAAGYVSQIGYKRFIATGWTIRLIFVLPLIAVPLLHGHISQDNQLAIVIGTLFCFNLVRGVASTAWFPWITGLIPEEIRGRYLTWENACYSLGSLLCLLFTAVLLGANPTNQKFAILFAFSLLTGLISLWFIYQVPDAPVNPEEIDHKQPAPWREILHHQPFRKLLEVHFAWAVLMGGLMAFIVKYLKGPVDMPDDLVVYADAAKYVGGLATLWFLRSRLDRLGSRPLMVLATGGWYLIILIWIGMSSKLIESTFGIVCAVSLLSGFAFCTFGMSLTKLVMGTVPESGKSHFFALYSVVGSLTLGICPFLWGILIDALEGVNVVWFGMNWNQYSIYFSSLVGVLIVLLILVLRLKEEKAANLNELVRDLIRHNPLRDWVRR